jgi:hypothetical protein
MAMRLVRLTALLAVASAVVLFTAGPSEAAKGVKKNGHHRVQGKVVSVHSGKKGQSTVTVQVHHHKKKSTATAGAVAAARIPAARVAAPRLAGATVAKTGKHHHHRSHQVTLQVDSRTQVTGVGNGRSGIHQGDHVVAMVTNHHADSIQVHHKKGT